MQTVNIHDAKTHLSRLIEQAAAKGEPFIIAKAGKPMVKVVPLDMPDRDQQQRIGFLMEKFKVPDDFDRMGDAQIGLLFGTGE